MSTRIVTPIWTPEDAHEVFERAATVKALEALPAAVAPVIDIFTGEVIP